MQKILTMEMIVIMKFKKGNMNRWSGGKMKQIRFINLRTVMISKKGILKIPDEVITKLKINIKIDAIKFVWDKKRKELNFKVLRCPK